MARWSCFLLAFISVLSLAAVEPERNFAGKWVLDEGSSKLQALPGEPERTLEVVQQDLAIRCTGTLLTGAQVKWSYLLDGSETRYRAGDESRSSVVKWEGAALLVNTIVSGPRSYTMMDRWTLNRDHRVLSIRRQIVTRSGEVEGVLVYRPEGGPAVQDMPAAPDLIRRVPPPPVPQVKPGTTILRDPPPPAELVIKAGTRIPLSLRNTVDTKHSHDGDRIYLETIIPMFIDETLVIPRGSFVNGTITKSTPAGRNKKKGELYIRFDSLTLPNGVTRDFRSRLGSADSAKGTVDRDEGKVTGERDTAGDARTVAGGATMGAGIGGLAGRSLGSAGIGGAAGAAAGLASIFIKRGPDAALPQGTTVEMILDRDLTFTREELGKPARY
jgi:hypothetical protein